MASLGKQSDMKKNIKNEATNKPGRPRTGSLEFRSGSWWARLTVTVDGESVRRWFRLDTEHKDVARRKLKRLNKDGEAPLPAKEVAERLERSETYAELAERVRENRREAGIKDTRSEVGREDNWVTPVIGALPLDKIRPADIAEVYKRAQLAGTSVAHLRNLRTVMNCRFKVALQDEMVDKNPVAVAALPKGKTDRRERAVLTDEELVRYLGWQHPLKQFQLGVLERQTMSVLARMFGGLRTGDIHAVTWSNFDVVDGAFAWGVAPRQKTERPQKFDVPEELRPILRYWWELNGRPTEGPIFPALRGKRAGETKMGVSHAEGLRSDLRRCFGLETWNPETRKWEATKNRKMTGRERELLVATTMTRPVDFHSWRRAFVQALANTGVTAQEAQKLAGHADLGAHERYLKSSTKTLVIPAAALPDLSSRVLPQAWAKLQNPKSTIQQDSWSQLRDLNSGPAVYETAALPLS